MRIAVTGTHGSGKTTLIDDFLYVHRDYAHEQEPYWALAQEGVVFADGPNIGDLEDQLGRSVDMILERQDDERVIFDRSPVDYLAYLEVISEREGAWTPGGKLLAGIEAALRSLDLIVFLPLSEPDDIKIRIEYPRLRRDVDRELKSILRDDTLELFAAGTPLVLEIQGTRTLRVALLEGALAP